MLIKETNILFQNTMANRLIHETSPYLLQHAHNPVDWYPYGEEAFAAARESNRPLLISIGYSACHWCHVMEHESFSKPEIAEVMNRNFVCIKVDREERPDVDLIYMSAVQLLHNSGGWPLNCFALPDGSPFWGGTYFRPAQWTELLTHISELYHNSYRELESQALRLKEGIAGLSVIKTPENPSGIDSEFIDEVWDQLSQRFDSHHGGTIGAPKFPMPVVWQFGIEYYNNTGNQEALNHILMTLDAMARGGIYDQIGGGFARYSTDAKWKVPHFEKMLYDNAQLVSLYAEAYRISGNEALADTIRQTLAFIENELRSPEGAFYSALDADSEGVEGKFYVWTRDEIMGILPEYGELLSSYWGIGQEGKWENGNNILLRPFPDSVFASRNHLSEEELKQLVRMAASRLLKERNKRIRPGLDDKILASWNGMTIKAYADAYRVTMYHPWLDAAVKAARFVKTGMIQEDYSILRTWKNGSARIPGVLNDYAYLAEAFITLYQVSFDEEWLYTASRLTRYVLDNFTDPDSPLFWFTPTPAGNGNAIRIRETTDGVEPSGNAVMAKVLLYLENFCNNNDYGIRAREMVNTMLNRIEAYPSAYSCWASAAQMMAQGIRTLVITGPRANDYALQLLPKLNSSVTMAVSKQSSSVPVFLNRFRNGDTVIYDCIGNVCHAPVSKPEELEL